MPDVDARSLASAKRFWYKSTRYSSDSKIRLELLVLHSITKQNCSVILEETVELLELDEIDVMLLALDTDSSLLLCGCFLISLASIGKLEVGSDSIPEDEDDDEVDDDELVQPGELDCLRRS